MMRTKIVLATLMFCHILTANAETKSGEPVSEIAIITPGNKSVTYELKPDMNGNLTTTNQLPLTITRKLFPENDITRIEVTITAQEKTYYNFTQKYILENSGHTDCQFYMPGFWYHKNLRSPQEAPSFHTSDSWQVREDRLSTPLTGIYNEKTGDYHTIQRIDEFADDCLVQHTSGEVILSGRTSIGFTGFQNVDGKSSLVFGFPYREAPKTYIRKLTLIPPVTAFEKLEKGESRKLVWEIKKGKAKDYSTFVADVWSYSFDTFAPKTVESQYDTRQAKETLSNFFSESYVDSYPLKYFSGVHMSTETCESTGIVEIGFVGRVLLNAFNALEYGESNNRPDLVKKANAIFDSFAENSFTGNGFFKEFIDYSTSFETDIYSIRRQSEGVFAVLNYLKYEKSKGRQHPEWEKKVTNLLDNFLKLQGADGSFPRKFDNNYNITDPSGGSTPSATLPLTMAYVYFNDKRYLESARKTAVYLEKELIEKADYFSSTLDANCEDKEASLYASTAMYLYRTIELRVQEILTNREFKK